MAAKSFGVVFMYGVTGTVTAAAVQSFKLKSEQKNTATTEEENGNEIERRRDDTHNEATIEIKYRSTFAIPSPSDILSYESASWEIVSIDRAEVCKGHRMITLTILNSQYINSASATSISTTAAP